MSVCVATPALAGQSRRVGKAQRTHASASRGISAWADEACPPYVTTDSRRRLLRSSLTRKSKPTAKIIATHAPKTMTDQQESVVLEFLAKAVIENESNSVRFENFCNEVIGKYAGITILPTSVSWDMGRDGRAITRDHSVATATSLRGDVDAKMVGDLQRMLPDLTTPARLYFCTSEYRSGYAIANLERTLRDLCPAGVTPFALGLKELVELGTRWPTSFLKFYTADYAELVTTLQSGQNATAETQDEALRLALSLFDNPDSAQLREGSYRTLILRVLQLKGACTVRELSSSASTLLRLGRPLPEVSLDSRLPKMIADGLIERVGVRYDTTPKGKDEIHNIDASIATQIIVGRNAMRAAYNRELGWDISEPHFERIWLNLRQSLSDLFFRRGREMVQLVGAIIAADSTQLTLDGGDTTDGGSNGTEREAKSDFFFLDELADRVASTSSNQAQQGELKQATKDLFLMRTGAAFEWLVHACANYVTLCSLGVEELTAKALANALANVDLILDTDVALSLLCCGESLHEGAKAAVERWPTLGARIYISEAVLREVAHHAWIAEQDYAAVESWVPGTRGDRLRLIGNAFARAFAEMLARKQVKKNQWNKFIKTYKGRSQDEYANVASAIFSKYKGTATLIKSEPQDHGLRSDVDYFLREYAERTLNGRPLRIARDKAARDAETYAAMVTHLRRARQSKAEASVFLVSSHHRLTDVERKFQRAGERYIVLSLSSIIYLLSLIPNVSVSFGAMEALLFGDGTLRMGADVDRMILRVISLSVENDLPWAHRPHLIQRVKELAIKEAHILRGERTSDPAEAIDLVLSTDEGPKHLALLIAKSMDELALESKPEQENRVLRAKLQQMEEELRAAKDRARRR